VIQSRKARILTSVDPYSLTDSVFSPCTITVPGNPVKRDSIFPRVWGDGTPATATIYYNDGIGPDPYPSPGGTFPFTAADSAQHVFSMAGDYSVRLTARDDDGGIAEVVIVLVIHWE